MQKKITIRDHLLKPIKMQKAKDFSNKYTLGKKSISFLKNPSTKKTAALKTLLNKNQQKIQTAVSNRLKNNFKLWIFKRKGICKNLYLNNQVKVISKIKSNSKSMKNQVQQKKIKINKLNLQNLKLINSSIFQKKIILVLLNSMHLIILLLLIYNLSAKRKLKINLLPITS